MIYDVLEIVIPTYNRAEVLKKTLNTLLESPIKECLITILDNNSTDKTAEIVQTVQKEHSNIKYIKNRYNFGLAGNLCKAMTIPEKKYFGIVFDDTGFDFSNWSYIEKGLNENADCVLTTNYYQVTNTDTIEDRAAIFLMLIYGFAGIYKTDLITDDVVLYALTDTYTVHPQMALISAVFNDENRKIFIPEKTVTFPQTNPETQRGEQYSFNRNKGDFYHFRISSCDFIPGFVCAIQSLKDEKLRRRCIEMLFESYNGIGPYADITVRKKLFEENRKRNDLSAVNYLDEYFFLKDVYNISFNNIVN